MPNELDLNQMLSRAAISIDPEEAEDEKAARLEKEKREHMFVGQRIRCFRGDPGIFDRHWGSVHL